MTFGVTPSQTIGPFFRIGLEPLYDADIAKTDTNGERITVRGRVLDGQGQPVPDAVVEIWQANSHGKYAHPDDDQATELQKGFSGFGRVPTDENGAFQFRTIKPGAVSGSDGREQAPHLVISIFMRGLLKGLQTRMYFPDEPQNAHDFVLGLVLPERRASLIARRMSGEGAALEWNVILQGEAETIFFDY